MNYYEDEDFSDQSNIPIFSEGTEFVCCRFSGLDMSDFPLKSVRFIECTFTKCNLSNIVVTNSSFRDVEFSQSKLLGINWASAQNLFDLKFKQCVLNYCSFSSNDIQGTIFKDCTMRSVEFSETNLKNSRFDYCDLAESSFHRSNLEYCDFREATNYYIDIASNRLKNALFSMPEAMVLLSSLGVIVE